MSIIRITGDDIETFTVVTNPKKIFASSSINGITTGSVNLFARRSDIEKETVDLSNFGVISSFKDNNLYSSLAVAKNSFAQGTNAESAMSAYLDRVNSVNSSARKQKQINAFRFEPSFTYTTNTSKKDTIKNILYQYYRPSSPDNHWAYSNYHCLNFFTASGLPSDSVLLFPNSSSIAGSSVSGTYMPAGPFTFEFYIKPTYKQDEETIDYKAGTIFHMSSTYAISLVSGTLKDSNGLADRFRIRLQLSHSADIIPSEATPGTYPNNLIFETSDNALKFNHWHHVAIRWGSNLINEGSGSFFIDGVEDTGFVIPSGTILPDAYNGLNSNPDVLCIGNFYDGTNQGLSAQSIFFNNEPSTRDGLLNLAPGFDRHMPNTFRFEHMLNAEIHDLRIYNVFRLASNIKADTSSGPDTLDNLLFYLPPFFTKESPFRQAVGESGGVLQTPFFAIDSTTDDPFNVAMSFGVGGHYMNTENFLRDFANNIYPRQLQLTASQITGETATASANALLYATSSVRRRNILLLPCDNGKFIPNFDLLLTGTKEVVPSSGSLMEKFVNDLGTLDLSYITLNNLVSTSSLRPGLIFESGSIMDGIAGASPEDPGVDPGEVLTIYQRTRDNSSNEVSFFEISNIFYGNRINPGSFSITDSDISGSGGKLSIKLKDNEFGNLYRADASSEHATWNSVGNIFYNEGIIVVKSPNIPFFGQDQFRMEFEGEQTTHVLKLSVEAAAGMINSSSNPNYQLISSSFNANEDDGEFVYITNIDWLDDNLNVIMKTNLAQPIKKRNSDKLLLRSKIDF